MEYSPDIVTVTVDPSLDLTATVDNVEPNRKLRAESVQHHPGGGGLNVAKVLGVFGQEAVALWCKGGPFGSYIEQLLEDEGAEHVRVDIEGANKQSFAVIEESSGDHYRFSTTGPELREDSMADLEEELRRRSLSWLVLSGGIPPGTPDDLHLRLAKAGRDQGARVVVDTHGPPLRSVIFGMEVFLAKPNRTELAEILDTDPDSDDFDPVVAGQEIVNSSAVENLVVSLGEDGALLVGADGVEHIQAPRVEIESRIGAGDSMVGGMLAQLVRGVSILDATRFGVAAGTAAVMTSGTELCRREQAETLFEKVRSRRIHDPGDQDRSTSPS